MNRKMKKKKKNKRKRKMNMKNDESGAISYHGGIVLQNLGDYPICKVRLDDEELKAVEADNEKIRRLHKKNAKLYGFIAGDYMFIALTRIRVTFAHLLTKPTLLASGFAKHVFELGRPLSVYLPYEVPEVNDIIALAKENDTSDIYEEVIFWVKSTKCLQKRLKCCVEKLEQKLKNSREVFIFARARQLFYDILSNPGPSTPLALRVCSLGERKIQLLQEVPELKDIIHLATSIQENENDDRSAELKTKVQSWVANTAHLKEKHDSYFSSPDLDYRYEKERVLRALRRIINKFLLDRQLLVLSFAEHVCNLTQEMDRNILDEVPEVEDISSLAKSILKNRNDGNETAQFPKNVEVWVENNTDLQDKLQSLIGKPELDKKTQNAVFGSLCTMVISFLSGDELLALGFAEQVLVLVRSERCVDILDELPEWRDIIYWAKKIDNGTTNLRKRAVSWLENTRDLLYKLKFWVKNTELDWTTHEYKFCSTSYDVLLKS